MEDVLRQRLIRRIESLPEAQIYQVLDYVEFLESKYSRASQLEPSVLQKFAEGVQDRMRKKAMNPATLREAFQLIAAADRVLADVSSAGKQILDELGGLGETAPGRRREGVPRAGGPSDQRIGSGRERGRERGAPASGESGSGHRKVDGDRDEVGLGEEWTPHEKPPGTDS